MKKSKPIISVIIPAYNEEKHIKSCLEALTNQTNSVSYEVIVVDNNSNDSTKKIAKKYTVSVVTEKKKGYVYALKTGVASASGDIILLTDADTIVPSTWIKKYYEFFQKHPSAVGATGPFIYIDGSRIVQSFTKILNTYIPRLLVSTTVGMNMGFRRIAYDTIGGFDPAINLQGDSYLGHKLHKIGRVGFLPTNTVYASGRRFPSVIILIKELILRLCNRISIIHWKKPLVNTFEDIR